MPAPTFYAKSITELIARNAAERPDVPAVHTGTAEFGDQLQTLTFSDIALAVDRLADYYSGKGLGLQVTNDRVPPERIIAVLISTAIDETLLEIALAKIGVAALLLSVNNSTAAVAHLCKITNSTCLIYGPKFEQTAKDVQKSLSSENINLDILPEKRFPLWGSDGVRESKIRPYRPALTPDQESKRTCVVLHSSGSTGFPKPVFISHYGLIANSAPALPKTGFSALPLFHGFGHFSIFRCFYHGQTFTLMPPHMPLTSSNICRVIKNSPTPPVQHFAVPYVLKMLAETEEGTQTLANFEAVSFAGAAVPDDLGDRLVAAGVNLISFYGTTETGAIMTSKRADYNNDKAWNWFRAEGPIAEYLELIPQGSDTFEVVVKDGWPAKIMSNREDGAYCTKDLVQQHPDHPTWFKYIGRLDDTLTQTLGEKTNPVPIELAIRGNSPLVQECIVFGDGRPQVGALILPSSAGADLSKDKQAFIDAIWPVVMEANLKAPTHSRILPDMIDILPYGTEIPVATKMSILRPACYKKFASIIEAIYARFEKGNDEMKRNITSQQEMEEFLMNTILNTLGQNRQCGLTPSTDLFSFGVDSLQATRIRNVISKSLKFNQAVVLGQNIVYEYPSVIKLAHFLLALQTGDVDTTDPEATHKIMLSMVEKHTAKFIDVDTTESSKISSITRDGEIVLLTGATGSLGAHILDQLTRLPKVSKIICLSRASSHTESLKRIKASLTTRQRTLNSDSASKIVSMAADVNQDFLGLTSEEYDSIRNEVTIVIHNAWPVNFSLSIESFDQHIRGAVNLFNLTLNSPKILKPVFLFSSSVSTRQGDSERIISEEFPSNPGQAAGMGYGQSKWVVEKILQAAGEKTKGRVGVLRIGQLTGDSENGIWNETEAWPLLFKSANVLQALPMLEERPSWLPVDQAAASIVEIASNLSYNAQSSSASVYHIVNPHTSSWPDILDGMAAGGLKFERISRFDWLKKLEKSDSDVSTNPTYKLLNFYRGRIGKKEERPLIEFQVVKSIKLSSTLQQVQACSPELMTKMVLSWRSSGFLR